MFTNILKNYPLILKYFSEVSINALLIQLERIQQDSFETPVFSGEKLVTPQLKIEIPRVLARLNCLLLLRHETADKASLENSYLEFTNDQTDNSRLSRKDFSYIAKQYRLLSSIEFTAMLIAASFVRTAIADDLLKLADPHFQFPEPGFGEVYRDIVFSNDKFYAFVDNSENQLIPLLHSLTKPNTVLKKIFSNMFNIGHLRQMLFCEGNHSLYQRILNRVTNENLHYQDLSNWFLLWMNNLMGFRSHIDSAKKGAAFFDRYIYEALCHLQKSIITMTFNALTTPKAIHIRLSEMAVNQYLINIAKMLGLKSLKLTAILALCMSFNLRLNNNDEKVLDKMISIQNSLLKNIEYPYLAVFFRNLLHLTQCSLQRTINIGLQILSQTALVAESQNCNTIDIKSDATFRLCFKQTSATNIINQLITHPQIPPIITVKNNMAYFFYFKPVEQHQAPTIMNYISMGELIDKLTILEIKLEKIKDPNALENVRVEHNVIQSSYHELKTKTSLDLENAKDTLKKINTKLWFLENKIRELQTKLQFDSSYIHITRQITQCNDVRSLYKKLLNKHLGSKFVEIKVHESNFLEGRLIAKL